VSNKPDQIVEIEEEKNEDVIKKIWGQAHNRITGILSPR
jgi:hypothetical protein